HEQVAVDLSGRIAVPDAEIAQAVVEGVLLARYQYDALRSKPGPSRVKRLTLVADRDPRELRAGVRRALAFAGTTMLARDLANTPHNHLSAARMGEVATALGADHGFEVEVFEKERLEELGMGGLLGVNAGSSEPPTMIVLRY